MRLAFRRTSGRSASTLGRARRRRWKPGFDRLESQILPSGSIVAWGNNSEGQIDVPAGTDYTAIAAGYDFGLALTFDGSIVGWGDNSEGQLDVPTGTGYTAIAAGNTFGLALTSNGSIVAWGGNGNVTAPAGTGYTAISAGASFGLALTSDGSIVGLGDDIGGPLPSGTGYTAIAAGNGFTAFALASDGSIVNFGANVPVPAGTGYTAIAAAAYYGLALTSNGSITGFVDTTENTLPTGMPSGTGNTAIAASNDFGLALQSDGSIVGWGLNYDGQTNTPAGSDFTAISSGGGWGLALEQASQASPTLVTTASPATVALGDSGSPTLTDSAVLSGGSDPTGTITFTLSGPSGKTVDTESVPVHGNGTYATPSGYTLPESGTVAGTYTWAASYNGDDNNNPANDQGGAEQTVVSPASPTLVTTATPSAVTVSNSGTVTLTDSATLASGHLSDGLASSITFTLTCNGKPVPAATQTDTVTRNGSYTAQYTLAASNGVAGIYLWSAVYSGDANNQSATDNSANEKTVVSVTSPTIIGEKAVWQHKLNKKGKPVGKLVLQGFTLQYNLAMGPSAASAVDYTLETIVSKATKNKPAKVKLVGFTVTYSPSNDTATLNLVGNQTFANGGLLIASSSIASTSGATLTGNRSFSIGKGGKTIGTS